jgi:rRNA N6-adenosine-methyltransferase METTL5
VTGVDVDIDAIDIGIENADNVEADVEFVVCDVSHTSAFRFSADTVIMNPPFGTRNKGIDSLFIEIASKIATGAIYSLHKSSTRKVGQSHGD